MAKDRPHLLTRFAASSLVAFVVVGLVASVVISHQARAQSERASREHAAFVTHSILGPLLEPRDLVRPIRVPSLRYRRIRRVVEQRVLHATFPVVRVKLWRADGTILFSDARELVGRRFEVDDDLKEALEGRVEAGVSDLAAGENVEERRLADKLFETYVPLHVGKHTAVVEIYSDLAPVSASVAGSFRSVAIALLVGLAFLYVLQLPIVRQIGQTLRNQNLRLERSLVTERSTVARLQELNRLKSGFVDVASHELRTPLTSIAGYAKMLRQPEHADNAETREEFLSVIERQSDRLSRLVDNLLVASQIEGQALQPQLAPVRFADMAEAVLMRFGERRRRVMLQIPEDLPEVPTDERLLELVLANLVDNALKFSPADEVCEVGALVQGGRFGFWVADRGEGIERAQLERIFQRFYQVDGSATRRHGGVGLGLSIVKESVSRLGGQLEVQSELGKGTLIRVTLPMTPPPALGPWVPQRERTDEGNGHGPEVNGHRDAPLAADDQRAAPTSDATLPG